MPPFSCGNIRLQYPINENKTTNPATENPLAARYAFIGTLL